MTHPVATRFRSIICDLDGVLYLGAQPVAGAGAALNALHGAGIDLLFVTNNSTKTPEAVADKIALRTGYPARSGQVVTSSLATAAHLAGRVRSALVVGAEGLVQALTDVGIDLVAVDDAGDEPVAVDAVVVGLDTNVTYRHLAVATLAVRAGARLVASNSDATFPTPHGQVPGAGSIVAAVERATGIEAESCGKPYPPMRRMLARRLDSDGVLVVGDRVDTDLALGWAEGWSTALVLSGVGSPEEAGDRKIDLILDSIADLPEALGL